MNKINFFYILEQEALEIFLKSPKNYFETLFRLKKGFLKCTVINFSKIIGKEIDNTNYKKKFKKYNIEYFCPSTKEDLFNKINTKNNYGMFKSSFGLKYFKILRILKKSKIKLIQISNYSFIFEKKTFEGRSIKQSFRIIVQMKLINYFHRFLCALNIFPKVHIHFDCDQDRIDTIKNSLSEKIRKLIPFLKLSFYKNVLRINSKYYSDFVKLKRYRLEKKYITFCDTPLAHGDFLLRDGPYDKEKVEEYYSKLNYFLKEIQKFFKKKVIICLHPKGEYNQFKNFKLLKKNFQTVFFKTEYYISKSFLVINITSSTINNAIIQNKPNIILRSKYFGNTVKGKIKNFQKELNYPIIDLENFNKNNLNQIIKQKYDKKKIEIYIKKKIFFEKNKTDTQQIMNILNNDKF